MIIWIIIIELQDRETPRAIVLHHHQHHKPHHHHHLVNPHHCRLHLEVTRQGDASSDCACRRSRHLEWHERPLMCIALYHKTHSRICVFVFLYLHICICICVFVFAYLCFSICIFVFVYFAVLGQSCSHKKTDIITGLGELIVDISRSI